MSGSACLDTSIVIRCLRGDPSLISRLYLLQSPIISGVALGELYYGAVLSHRSEAEIRKIDAFIANCQLAFPDKLTSAVYADVKVALRRAGTPIPENDIWIAALCIQQDWELAFRDKHFPLVPGLRCLPW